MLARWTTTELLAEELIKPEEITPQNIYLYTHQAA